MYRLWIVEKLLHMQTPTMKKTTLDVLKGYRHEQHLNNGELHKILK